MPGDRDFAFILRGNLGESSNGEINGVAIGASGAIIRNGDSDGLAIVGVGDLHLFTAKGRGVARIAIAILIDGSDEVRIAVDSSARAGIAFLEEESGKSASDFTRRRRSSSRSGRRLGVVGCVGGSGSRRRRRSRRGRIIFNVGRGSLFFAIVAIAGTVRAGRVRVAFLRTGGKELTGGHRGATCVEKRSIVLVLTVQSHVTAMVSVIILEIEVAPASRLGRRRRTRHGEGISEWKCRGGEKERQDGESCEHFE
jgi:hypothetical protein